MTKYKKNELIEKEIVRRIIDSPRTKQQMLDMLESIEPIIQTESAITYCGGGIGRRLCVRQLTD